MKAFALAILLLASQAIERPAFAQKAAVQDAPAQAAEQTVPVWRSIEIRIKPGQTDAFWKDMRENGLAMFDMAKEQGLIAGYELLSNPYKAEAGEWDALLMLKFDNFAALDRLEARGGELYMKHYGPERLKTLAAERDALREVVADRVLRGMPTP